MFFFRSQFSFWAFPHQSLCLCCPGARLQRKGEAVPFFSSFIAKLCRPKRQIVFIITWLVVGRSVDVTINFLLFLHCSCSPLRQNISLLQIFSSFCFSILLLSPPQNIFLPLHKKIEISKRVLHCLLGLFFIQVFNTNHIPFMSALVNYGAVVMLMQV